MGKGASVPFELTSFVGRRREMGEFKNLLTASRLVTLTGVGGVGKTRLALRVAAGVERAFGDGAWLVDLTEMQGGTSLAQQLENPDVLAYLVMAALGLRQGAGSPMGQLTEFLVGRRSLLVLDKL